MFLCLDGFAQHILKGKILDQNTGEPLIGAAVQLKGTTTGGVTDIDGNFQFSVQELPPFTLVVSFIGYQPVEYEVSSLDDELKFELSTDQVLMSEVQVIGSRISEKEKQAPLTIESMDVIAIKETSASNFYEGLGQLKGVDLTSASLGFKVINTRGFNSTSPVRSLQLIDGMDNQAPGLNFSLGNFLGASELDVMKVDLVVGASSAFYGPGAFNGVINMTTKDPFTFPGLSVMSKVGERGLFENAFRYAKVVKDKWGFKFNFYYMVANDWEATNYDASEDSEKGVDNPGGYDAVNIYGDEFSFNGESTSQLINFPGLGRWYRTGYREIDLVDYRTENLKLNGAVYYKINDSTQIIASSNFGTGTTVYQGDNRYSLKDILFMQNKLEVKQKDKYFIRAYATHEDAGNSYDAVFTALLLQEASKTNNMWQANYRNYWSSSIMNGSGSIPLPGFEPWQFGDDVDEWISETQALYALYADSLFTWHNSARAVADDTRLIPGTPEFQEEFEKITSKATLAEGGTRFFDRSALYHVQGEYKFKPSFAELVVGGNWRLYAPNSQGSIFRDTLNSATGEYRRIYNREYGLFLGVEKKVFNENLKLNGTIRMDKNENFDAVISPALSAVYTFQSTHVFRLSFSSALRNPTLQDQYLYYNVGRAILIGNLDGFDSLVTIPSLEFYFRQPSFDKDLLEYFDVDPIRPERVRTVEVGYRTTLSDKVYFDASAYYSTYEDFIGFNLGAGNISFSALNPNEINGLQVFRVASNAQSQVTTRGVSVGLNYYIGKFYALTTNYSWNKLDKEGADDPIIPAFNTPEHKFNVGFSGRDIITEKFKNYGFSVNYKWIEGFLFEGSPQFTGFIPTYDLVDAQVNKFLPKQKITLKLGASNLLNKKQFQVYGGPRVGRMAYFSILFELKD